MNKIKNGDRVSIHCAVKLVNGQEIFSTKTGDPLEFTVGEGSVITGLENALLGMEESATKTIRIQSKDAYGEHDKDKVITIERNQIPSHIDLEIGSQLEMQDDLGQIVPVMVTDITEDSVTLDANHPLAGMDLILDIEVLSINP